MSKFPLDKNTFGSESAAVILAELLSKEANTKWLAKVSSYLTQLNFLLRQIQDIQDTSSRLSVYNLVYEANRKHKFATNIPERIQTFTRNVALTQIKQYRDIDEAIVRQEMAADARERNLLKNLEHAS